MKRPGHEHVSFFLGTEVEQTPAFGKKTLFVVGTHNIEDIMRVLAEYDSLVEHIFFGANHSFNPKDAIEWKIWEDMIKFFLNRGYLCSLDIPVQCVEEFHECGLCEYNNFIPQLRISIPYIKLWNYNTMLKIDDRDFNATNPGVWCHSLHSLMTRGAFTDWNDYKKDETI